KRVQLWTGQSVGVGEGAQFAVYPQGTADLTDPGGRKAVVEVSEDQAVQSWARLVWPDKMPTPEIVPGDQAVLLGAGSSDLVRGVRMIRPKGEPINDDDKALRAVEAAVRAGGSGWAEL